MVDTIAVVVLNFRNYTALDRAISSILQCQIPTGCKLRVVAVDSQSDKTKLQTVQRSFKRVEFLAREENTGCGGGYNIGISHFLKRSGREKNTYILLMNADVWLDRKTIVALHACLEKDPRLALVTPKILLPTKPPRIYFIQGNIDVKCLSGGHRGWNQVDRGQYDKVTTSDYANMAAVLMRADIIHKVGFFDSSFFLYYEDTDLSFRVKRRGYRLGVATNAVAWHKESSCVKKSTVDIKEYYLARNHILFLKRNFPWWRRMRAYICILREVLFRARQLFTRTANDSLVNKLYFLGIIDGFKGKGGPRNFRKL